MKSDFHGDFQQEKRSVALLIDGENISAEFAAKILVCAGQRHELTVKRVYGDATAIPCWAKAPGFRLIHTGSGKNSADMMLVMQAVEMALTHDFTSFAIVSSDSDFSHLAHFLREKGVQVIGIGESKAPEKFRKACSTFHELSLTKPVSTPAPPPEIPRGPIDRQIAQIIKFNSNGNGLKLTQLGAKMYAQFHVKISALDERNWRKYLSDRPQIYRVDPSGAEARVHLIPGKNQ